MLTFCTLSLFLAGMRDVIRQGCYGHCWWGVLHEGRDISVEKGVAGRTVMFVERADRRCVVVFGSSIVVISVVMVVVVVR